MNKIFMPLSFLVALFFSFTAYAVTISDYLDSHSTYLPNYDLNDACGYCCGPAAGAEILAYWDNYHGKENLWEPDSDYSNGVDIMTHLMSDMNTSSSVGTTPSDLMDGLEDHADNSCGNPSPSTAVPLPNYSANLALYEKTGGYTLENMMDVIKDEIANDHPIAIYIGHYPRHYDRSILYQYYNYHWQVIYGYEEVTDTYGNVESFTVYTRTGFGGVNGYMDLVVYWNYENRWGHGIDDIAIVTFDIP